VQPIVTWYEILGVMPGATTEEIQGQYDSQASLLRPELISGAPSPVITAVSRAQQLLDTARDVLGNPATRARYDATAGIRRSGGGLAHTDWLAPHPGPPRWVMVPDVRGLFYPVCLQIVGKLGLRIKRIQLTEHPMPVEGLVVGQSPRPATKVRRASELTVQVWHPPN